MASLLGRKRPLDDGSSPASKHHGQRRTAPSSPVRTSAVSQHPSIVFTSTPQATHAVNVPNATEHPYSAPTQQLLPVVRGATNPYSPAVVLVLQSNSTPAAGTKTHSLTSPAPAVFHTTASGIPSVQAHGAAPMYTPEVVLLSHDHTGTPVATVLHSNPIAAHTPPPQQAHAGSAPVTSSPIRRQSPRNIQIELSRPLDQMKYPLHSPQLTLSPLRRQTPGNPTTAYSQPAQGFLHSPIRQGTWQVPEPQFPDDERPAGEREDNAGQRYSKELLLAACHRRDAEDNFATVWAQECGQVMDLNLMSAQEDDDVDLDQAYLVENIPLTASVSYVKRMLLRLSREANHDPIAYCMLELQTPDGTAIPELGPDGAPTSLSDLGLTHGSTLAFNLHSMPPGTVFVEGYDLDYADDMVKQYTRQGHVLPRSTPYAPPSPGPSHTVPNMPYLPTLSPAAPSRGLSHAAQDPHDVHSTMPSATTQTASFAVHGRGPAALPRAVNGGPRARRNAVFEGQQRGRAGMGGGRAALGRRRGLYGAVDEGERVDVPYQERERVDALLCQERERVDAPLPVEDGAEMDVEPREREGDAGDEQAVQAEVPHEAVHMVGAVPEEVQDGAEAGIQEADEGVRQEDDAFMQGGEDRVHAADIADREVAGGEREGEEEGEAEDYEDEQGTGVSLPEVDDTRDEDYQPGEEDRADEDTVAEDYQEWEGAVGHREQEDHAGFSERQRQRANVEGEVGANDDVREEEQENERGETGAGQAGVADIRDRAEGSGEKQGEGHRGRQVPVRRGGRQQRQRQQEEDDDFLDDLVGGSGAGKGVRFSLQEIQNLISGVELYGLGAWKSILSHYRFHPTRDPVKLKDKWRNLVNQVKMAKKPRSHLLPDPMKQQIRKLITEHDC